MYYLAHHGIKGQKWGIRRYQNEDGTLTPLGRSRERGEATSDASSTVYKRGKTPSSSSSSNQRVIYNWAGQAFYTDHKLNSSMKTAKSSLAKDSNPKYYNFNTGLSYNPDKFQDNRNVTRSNFGSSEFDVPNESERARERAKKEYEEWYDKYNEAITEYIVPYQDVEFVDINQFESDPRNKITPDLDGKASSGQATIKQYNDRSKDHTSKSYKDQHSIDTNLNSQLANIQKKDYSEHIHAAVQRGIKEVTSIIRNVLTKNKTKSDNRKRK